MDASEIIADLHLHSKYARAVSAAMTPPVISAWAAKKGIGLVGTGDFTHPLWLKELEANLEEAGEGVYRLRQSPESSSPLFILTTELSCIYSHNGKTRRIHLLVLLPSFSDIHKLVRQLQARGVNLSADGRPILGLSLIQLSEIILSINQQALLIPAHAWTPWFGVYGHNGGYDNLEEAFGSFAKNIPAIETGMSSDPAMNWRIAELDNRQIVSFGDAHSPAKLGREATVFRITNHESRIKAKNLSYKDVYDAITGNKNRNWEIGSTIEFYPEEGKYHFTGHRNCKVRYSPEETKKVGTSCPVCGKPLTIGVAHRVEKLATREVSLSLSLSSSGVKGIKNAERSDRPGYVMLVPLQEILAEALGTGVISQKVQNTYEDLCRNFTSEFTVLLETPLTEIAKRAGERTAEGISKVRRGDIVVDPGYDGVFGTVKIWGSKKEEAPPAAQGSLF